MSIVYVGYHTLYVKGQVPDVCVCVCEWTEIHSISLCEVDLHLTNHLSTLYKIVVPFLTQLHMSHQVSPRGSAIEYVI